MHPRPWRQIRYGFATFAVALTLACGGGAADDTAVDDDSVRPAVPTLPDVSALQAAGSRRMARRLALITEQSAPLESVFRNDERLAALRSLPLPDHPRQRLRARLNVAQEMLRAGESEAAAAAFKAVIETMEADPSTHSPALLKRAKILWATAYLRLGEQQNCLEHLGSAACILPIEAAARHHFEEGSRQAQAVLADLLRDDPTDLQSLWLFNLAAMTLGEYPQDVPAAWRLDPRHFDPQRFDPQRFGEAQTVPRWTDRAPELGLDVEGLAGGSVVDDFDGDGHLDVMVSSWGVKDPLRVFFARRHSETGHLSFKEGSLQAGLSGLVGGLNLVSADYDNDGDVDVLVLRGAWLGAQGRYPNSLLRNDGRGRFEDVTEEVGLLSFHPTQAAAWGDVDHDGWLDLYIGNESTAFERHPAELYLSRVDPATGERRFVEVARQAGVTAGGFIKGVAWGDIDNDGWLDLYVSRMQGANRLFRHRGLDAAGWPRFEDVSEAAGVQDPWDSFPTWFFDYDQDGWLDLFAADYATNFVDARSTGTIADYLGRPAEGSTSRLYRNRGDGTFEDVSAATGLNRPLLAMGANFGDIDNDGWLDLYIGTGAPDFSALVPNRLFRNEGGSRFQDVTLAARLGHLQKGHGISFADLDHDGDQDIVAVLGGAFSGDVYRNAAFINPGHGNGWITLTLEGVEANRSALGARLRLSLATPSGERDIFATVSTGGSFGASTIRQELGLGNATAVTAIEVQWPGGGMDVFHDLPMRRHWRLRQGSPTVEELPFESWSLPRDP